MPSRCRAGRQSDGHSAVKDRTNIVSERLSAKLVTHTSPARRMPSLGPHSLRDLSEHFVGLFDSLDTIIRPTIACETNTFLQQTYGVLQARVFVVPLRMPRV